MQRTDHCVASLPRAHAAAANCGECELNGGRVGVNLCSAIRLPTGCPFMEALKLLLTTDVGLLSLGAILFMIVMAIYLFTRFRKLMNEKPGQGRLGLIARNPLSCNRLSAMGA